MARLFQITRLSNELMPTTSAWWCIDSSREILPWPYPRYRVERGKRFTNERTNEGTRLCFRSLMRGGRNTQGWVVACPTPHTSRWHSSNYVFPDLSRLPTVPNIAQRFHHALFEGLFSTEHLHPRGARCHCGSCWNARTWRAISSFLLLPPWTSLSLAMRPARECHIWGLAIFLSSPICQFLGDRVFNL